MPNGSFRLIKSLALRASSLAIAACWILPIIDLASFGFSSKNSESLEDSVVSVKDLISDETSLYLVWDEKTH
jgi:hypothetical protein